MQIWKDIKGYQGLYKVSNLGKILSLKDCNGIHRQMQLKGQTGKNNRTRVVLYKNGVCKRYLRYRLVAQAFIDKIEGKNIVDHINGITTDDRAENLRWCTIKENSNFPLAIKNKKEAMKNNKQVRIQSLRKAKDNLSKPFISINLITGQKKTWNNQTKCGRELNIDRRNINCILNKNKKWHSIHNYTFVYNEEEN